MSWGNNEGKIQIIAENTGVKFQSNCEIAVSKIKETCHKGKYVKSMHIYIKLFILDQNSM